MKYAALLTLFLLLLLPVRLLAAPQSYLLDPARSEISFRYTVGGIESTGTIPLQSAAMSIDFQRLENTSIAVTLDATRARTVLPLAETALKGASVLDTARFPTIRFQSAKVLRDPPGALMTGDLTVRGQTLPVTLKARFFRLPDRSPEDLSEVDILLEGRLSRSAFGASGYPDLVADPVDLRIRATLVRAD
jgi:polyisoprenoid-binding protein YceI